MKLGIDSYSFHRYFGERYEGQSDPGRRLSIEDFLDEAGRLGVVGVSLESSFFGEITMESVVALRRSLDRRGLERVWAWGHPNGLASGSDPAALDDLIRHIKVARDLGASVMRICAGGRHTRPASWADHKARLLPMLRQLIVPAREHGVIIAIENHLDLTTEELIELLEALNSPWIGVCLDTANNLRLFEDASVAAERLAPFTRATHIKDIVATGGDPRSFSFWPSVPVGQGIVDMKHVLRTLKTADYDGLLAVEIDYLDPRYGDEFAAIAESIDWLKNALDAI